MKTTGYIALFSVAFFLIVGNARAEDISVSKQEKLGRLLEIMRLEQSLSLGIRSCVESSLSGQHSPNKVWEKEGKYHGLTPKSEEWPEALLAFRRFSERTCASGSSASMYKQMFVNFYGTRLNEKDIDSVLKYMESPTGQAFMKYQDEFQTVLSDDANKRSIASQEAARDAYWQEIGLLAGRVQKRKSSEWWKFWK